ncbi:MAG: hypothetical protein VX642_12260 [Bdellovibrionota bacterium]|nr:hypothetical protein [Bdellovibrionota bacterium]
MTTELVILLSFIVVIMLSVLQKLPSSFENSAGYLSARIEKQIETGGGFVKADTDTEWIAPD